MNASSNNSVSANNVNAVLFNAVLSPVIVSSETYTVAEQALYDLTQRGYAWTFHSLNVGETRRFEVFKAVVILEGINLLATSELRKTAIKRISAMIDSDSQNANVKYWVDMAGKFCKAHDAGHSISDIQSPTALKVITAKKKATANISTVDSSSILLAADVAAREESAVAVAAAVAAADAAKQEEISRNARETVLNASIGKLQTELRDAENAARVAGDKAAVNEGYIADYAAQISFMRGIMTKQQLSKVDAWLTK